MKEQTAKSMQARIYTAYNPGLPKISKGLTTSSTCYLLPPGGRLPSDLGYSHCGHP